MEKQVNLERNKSFHLEDSVVMYGIYNSEMIEKWINTIQNIHNKTTWNENLFVQKLNYWYHWHLSEAGAMHYTTNSFLYITTLREKCIKLNGNHINELQIYDNVIRILSKGYLPISLLLQ